MSVQEIGFKAVIDLNDYRKGIKEYTKGIKLVESATVTATGKAQSSLVSLGGTMNKVGSIASGAFKAGLATAAIGVTGLVVGLGSLITTGVKTAISMEQSIADIRTTFSTARPSVEQLQEAINALGVDPKLKVSASEAAATIELLARNGLSWQEIANGAAKSSILLANATGAEFGDAANVATDVMALFNIKAADMEQAVDGITSVAVNSKFGFNDFTNALANGGAAAANLGVNFEDFNTSIAAMASNFKGGAEAGTSFRTLIQRLVPSTKPATAAMMELGLITEDGSNKFFDAQGNMKSMAEVSGILQTSFGGLGDAQLSTAVKTIFGADALGAMLGLVRTGKDDFEALQAQMGQTNAADIVAERMKTLQGTLEVLGGLFETLTMSIGNAFLPALQTLASTLLAFIDKNGELVLPFFNRLGSLLASAIPSAINTLVGVWSSVLIPAFNAASTILTTFVLPTFMKFRDFISNQLNPAIEVGASLWRITLLPALREISSLISNSLLPAIGNLSFGLSDSLDQSTKSVTSTWVSTLLPAFKTVQGFLNTSVIPTLKTLISFIKDNLPSAINTAKGFITDTLIPAFTGFIEYIQINVLPLLKNTLKNAITRLSKLWTDVLLPAVDDVKEGFGNLVQFWKENGPEILRIALEVFNTFSDTIFNITSVVIPLLVAKFKEISAWWVTNGPTIVAFVSDMSEQFQTLGNFIQTTVNRFILPALDKLSTVLLSIGTLILSISRGDWPTAWSAMRTTVNSIASGIKLTVKGFVEAVATILGGSFSGPGGIRETWGANWNLMIEAVRGKKRSFATVLNGYVQAVKDTFSIDWRQIGKNIIDGIIKGLESGKNLVFTVIRDIGFGAINTMQSTLGVQSPSKVFEEIWDNTTKGSILGVDKNKNELLNTLRTQAMDAIQLTSDIAVLPTQQTLTSGLETSQMPLSTSSSVSNNSSSTVNSNNNTFHNSFSTPNNGNNSNMETQIVRRVKREILAEIGAI